MPIAFQPGNAVVQKVKPIEGTIVGPEIIDGDVRFKVAFMGEDGESHERTFREDEIELKQE